MSPNPEFTPSSCLMVVLNQLESAGGTVYEAGSVRELTCDSTAAVAGRVGCNYSCTVRFGKGNTVAEIIDDSGVPECL